MKVETWTLDKLTPYAANPRKISKQAVAKVAESIRAFGFQQPIVVDPKGVIVVGHARHLAAKRLKLKQVPVIVANLSDEKARAYRIADNRTHDESQWEDAMLRAELAAMFSNGGAGLFLGFDEDELKELLRPLSDEDLVDQDEDKTKLLDLINVVISPPRHEVVKGDHYEIEHAGQTAIVKHHLLCTGVMTGWAQWVPLLTEGALFCPYPGPFVTYGKIAEMHSLVMVQPDVYACGHILDRYEETHGPGTISKVVTSED